jgi:hypothetical protein
LNNASASLEEEEVTRIDFLDFDNFFETPKKETDKFLKASNADLEMMK